MTDRAHEYEFDVVVVGAGPAGLAAATVAAESGRRVGLIEGTPWLGGQTWRGQEAHPTSAAARRWFGRLRRSGAQVLRLTTVCAAPASNVLLAEQATAGCESSQPALARRTPALDPCTSPAAPKSASASLTIGWRKLVLATGARELFLPFPGWTLPNVMGAGGLSALAKGGLPVRGKRVVVTGSGPLLLAVAAELRRHGARVACIAEQADFGPLLRFGLRLPTLAPMKLFQAIRLQSKLLGVPHHTRAWPLRASGGASVEEVELTDGTRRWAVPCDYLACGFGLVPNLELPRLLGCRICQGLVGVDAWQQTSVPDVFCAGEPTGIGGAERAIIEGEIAGLVAAGRQAEAYRLRPAHARQQQFAEALARAFTLRPELKQLARPDTIVCRCEDVPRESLEGRQSWHEAKLHTRCGMGPCQGRICGAATRLLFGWDNESVRPPVLPVRVGSLRHVESP